MVDRTTPCLQGLKSTKKFLCSLGRFGNSPFLWSMYGSGELPQAFCRLCAVFGGTYFLGKRIDGIILKENNIKGIITNGQRISCSHFVIGTSNCPKSLMDKCNLQIEEVTLNRKICLLSESVLPHEREQLTFVSLPAEQCDRAVNEKPLTSNTFVQEVGFGPAVCPKGMYVLHMTNKQVHEEPVCKSIDVSSILSDKEALLWTLDFKIRSKQVHLSAEDLSTVDNIYLCNGPYFELDYDMTIENAKKICGRIYPEEEFLPRAPDPEEIIIGEENPDDEKSSKSCKDDRTNYVNEGSNIEKSDETESKEHLHSVDHLGETA